MNRSAATATVLVCALSGACSHLTPVAANHPADKWSVDYESSALWRVTNSPPISYVILPQSLSIRTPQHYHTRLAGRDLTLRARFSLLAEPVVRGPEHAYVGIAAAPQLEWWFAGPRACLYASAGGGCGLIDSTNVPGGQGQDFTLNWFVAGGTRYYPRPDLAVSAGVLFQHLSNGGATDPNPGLNCLGPTLGVSWSF